MDSRPSQLPKQQKAQQPQKQATPSAVGGWGRGGSGGGGGGGLLSWLFNLNPAKYPTSVNYYPNSDDATSTVQQSTSTSSSTVSSSSNDSPNYSAADSAASTAQLSQMTWAAKSPLISVNSGDSSLKSAAALFGARRRRDSEMYRDLNANAPNNF